MKKSVVVAASLLWASVSVNAECDLNQGKKVFNKCAACHSVEAGKHMMGPSLHGVVGRKAGKTDGFLYSMAMEASGFVWTNERLSDFIASPMSYVAGTSMPFGGIKKVDDREALICYLKGLK
ncbi:MAG: cytochrome c family protein [Cellvibrionaceae bacterium]|nr:cytochrome c family protein [Cellvibrionaceae bacterium]|tara:strand:+ start:9419 stop:9784 length:366 start_codon:yes stop_codon:yes gene_type:complete